ncbi:MAG: UvrD-helicase domain-containing protein [Candidatus Thiodiazotropha lotti]
MSGFNFSAIKPTEADIHIRQCLDDYQNFSVVAGAGSGKTTSLVLALDYLRSTKGKALRRDDQKIACITFTNRAVSVISERLGWDDIYLVSTLHRFLWGEIKRFSNDIRKCLQEQLIPDQIEKYRARDNGGNSQRAIAAREKITSLTGDLAALEEVDSFKYDETSNFSNYSDGRLSHDDVIAISGLMILENDIFQRVIGQKYPYIFFDEAQDTFEEIVMSFNDVCSGEGLPLIGYFGDPMQQIYDRGMGNFSGPEGAIEITKQENFRCAPEVIELLNSFRADVQQVAAGANANVEGSVALILVPSEHPEEPRNRYSEDQLDRTAAKFDAILGSLGWHQNDNVKFLFLVRQMIARRLGFSDLHKLFTGEFASSRAQEDYESGEHSLLKPFVKFIWPLVESYEHEDIRTVMNILREHSPAFDPEGENEQKSLKKMLELAESLVNELTQRWRSDNLGSILRFVRENYLYNFSDRLIAEMDREPMQEAYDKSTHGTEKGRWLADIFFTMDTSQIGRYVDFVNDNTPFSTQHGVKGEEYSNVVVVFDDTEAAWNLYSFAKTLTPQTSGEGTEGQLSRSRKLAYVCFSRAEVNLKVILFTPDPEKAKNELVNAGLFKVDQISVQES